ncbi:hypothetical protein [uncultured Pedobacter sp.]|uniref:hypothetical protein n=1 Tax=uncultured Pedobacter sp. TaxID=246139 RepID=UPI0025F0601A|nr:hypothetical protein [uncultured Pedobacter sp.]
MIYARRKFVTLCQKHFKVKKCEDITKGITTDVKNKITKILLVFYREGGVRTVDIEELTDIPAKSLERYIKQLKDADIVEFKGANRTGGYYLTEKAKNSISK